MLFLFMVDKTFAKPIITSANWQDIGETMASNIVVSNGADITFLLYFSEFHIYHKLSSFSHYVFIAADHHFDMLYETTHQTRVQNT